MAAIDFTEETKQHVERIGSADVVVGVAGEASPDDLQARAERVIRELGSSVSSLKYVFARPGTAAEAASEAETQTDGSPSILSFAPSPQQGGEFWSAISASQRAVLSLAARLKARACIVLGADLTALEPQVIQLFSYAVLDRQCSLAMPVYPVGRYDGLINTAILAPLSRALYGKRIRYPLTFDFAASGELCPRLAQAEPGNHSGNSLLWPVTIAATQSAPAAVGQVFIDVHHQTPASGLELSAVLGQLAGSLFLEMEFCASQWQRVRGSQPAPVWGAAPAAESEEPAIDPRPMLDSFLLGSKNLDEVWRLVLPPNTMLELRRLTRLPHEQFVLPDELWAGIVYDFALAYRLRTMSRAHLLGALTPIYLGWAASWVRQVAALSRAATEQRMEQFARAWEEKKPYLLSRWRWPDRFNP